MNFIHIYLSVYTSTPSQQTIPWVQHTLRHIHSLPHIHLLPPIPYLSLPCSVSGGTGNIEGIPTWCVTTSFMTVPSALAQPLQVVPILRTWFSSAVSYTHTHVCMHDHDILSICEVICSMLLFLYSKSLYMYHAHSATVVMYVHMYHFPHYISTLPLHCR